MSEPTTSLPPDAPAGAKPKAAKKPRPKAVDHFIALRTGFVELPSGKKMKIKKLQPFTAEKGALDYLFDSDGNSKVAEKVRTP